MCARRYAGVSSPAFFRCVAANPIACIPVNDDCGEQVQTCDAEVLAFGGAVSDFAQGNGQIHVVSAAPPVSLAANWAASCIQRVVPKQCHLVCGKIKKGRVL